MNIREINSHPRGIFKMDEIEAEPPHKKLKEYNDNELKWFLDNNEITDHFVLSCICSEILRRKLNEST